MGLIQKNTFCFLAFLAPLLSFGQGLALPERDYLHSVDLHGDFRLRSNSPDSGLYLMAVDSLGKTTWAAVSGGGGSNYASASLAANGNRTHTWAGFDQQENFSTGDFTQTFTGGGNASISFAGGSGNFKVTSGLRPTSGVVNIVSNSAGSTAVSDELVLRAESSTGQRLLSVAKNGAFVAGLESASLLDTVPADLVAIGYRALASMAGTPANGFGGVYIGAHAGEDLTSESSNGNVYIGEFAASNQVGGLTARLNTAVGSNSLTGATGSTAHLMTTVGNGSLAAVTTAQQDAALGYQAMALTTTGSYNACVGVQCLYSQTTGARNTAIGYQAGFGVTTGTFNVIMGNRPSASFAIGTGSYNVLLGNDAVGTALQSANQSNQVNLSGILTGVNAAASASRQVHLACKPSSITTSRMSNNQLAFSVDEVTDILTITVKYGDGTTHTGTVTLTP